MEPMEHIVRHFKVIAKQRRSCSWSGSYSGAKRGGGRELCLDSHEYIELSNINKQTRMNQREMFDLKIPKQNSQEEKRFNKIKIRRNFTNI